MLDSFQFCLGWQRLPPTEASLCKPVQKQNSTAFYNYPLRSHKGARSKSKDSKHNWHFEREKEVETKVNGNILRLPPETCLSRTISCPIIFWPFVLKELGKPAKPKFTYFLLWAPGIRQSKGTVSSSLKSTNGPDKSGKYHEKSSK